MKKERNYLPVMVILVLVVIGIFLWILLRDWHESRVDSARKQESQEWKQRAEVLTRKLTEREQELGAARSEKPSEEKVAEVFGPPAVEAPAREKPLAAEEIERRVKAFFSYLALGLAVTLPAINPTAVTNMAATGKAHRWRRPKKSRCGINRPSIQAINSTGTIMSSVPKPIYMA